MFRQILVATDLTPTSGNAVKRADALARDEGARLHILHVVRDPATQPWTVESYGVDWEGLRAEAGGDGRRRRDRSPTSAAADQATRRRRAGSPSATSRST